MDTPPAAEAQDAGQITRLARRIQGGDGQAAEELLGLVYQRLRATAAAVFAEGTGHPTLQPTLLVHDAFFKLQAHAGRMKSREHFYALAALAMRQVLRDYGRNRSAKKRGGEWERVSLNVVADLPEEGPLDWGQLDSAIDRLAALSPRQAQIVELRFLTGLSVEEVARVLGFSTTLIGNEWRMARAFLRRELSEEA